MKYQIEYACACFRGLVRQNNEDNFWCNGKYLPCINDGSEEIITGDFCDEEFPRFAVFDGMGGEEYGEKAAYIATKEFDYFQENWQRTSKTDAEEFIQTLCQTLNNDVFNYAHKERIVSGSTTAMLFFHGQNVYSANLGDSRVYVYQDQQFKQISEDHVCQNALYKYPLLTQFLGISPYEMIVSPCIRKLDCDKKMSFLLCSDGLTKMFTDGELEKALDKENSVCDTVSYLREETFRRGAWDNTTLILCEIIPDKKE